MVELKDKMNSFLQDIEKLKNYEYNLVKSSLNVVEAKPGSITAEYKVKKNVCNHRDTLHGGAAAGFADIIFFLTWASTLGINEKIINLPSTVNINLNYMSTIKLDETLLIHSKVETKTKSLLFLKLDIVNKENNKLSYTATGVLKFSPKEITSKL